MSRTVEPHVSGMDPGKLDGVAGLEPANDGIKIHCLTNLAIPQLLELKNDDSDFDKINQ